ncbi:unnamed protein product, partial [marine sediment metagenome]
QGCLDYARNYDWGRIAEMVEVVYKAALGKESHERHAGAR